MNRFEDLNVTAERPFIGEKISIRKLLDEEIKVLNFKVSPSKKKIGTDFLTLQIELKGEKRVVFSGAKALINQLEHVPKEKLPFLTTIKTRMSITNLLNC